MRNDTPDRLDVLMDAGIDRLLDEAPMSDEAFAAGRLRLLDRLAATTTEAVIPPQRRRRLNRTALLATAAGVLAAGIMATQFIDFGGRAPQAGAAPLLNRSADLVIHNVDTPLGPNQFRYVVREARGIGITYGGTEAVEYQVRQQTWIPADPRQDWFERRKDIGAAKWVPGHEGKGAPQGSSGGLQGEWTAKCGAFGYWAEGSKPSCDNGTWANPTPEFLAALPTDPKNLYDQLMAEYAASGQPEANTVMTIGNALATGRIPAGIRANFYRALAYAPDLRVTEDQANLDGRKGTALGITAFGDRTDLLIDTKTGEFIGVREVMSEDANGFKAGTVRQSTATSTAVVNRLGEEPAK